MKHTVYSDEIKRLARIPVTGMPPLNLTAAVILNNPLCGDTVKMSLNCDDKYVITVSIDVRACLLCNAASNLVASRAPGLSIEAVRANIQAIRGRLAGERGECGQPYWDELDNFNPVIPYRHRHRCVLLPFDALSALVQHKTTVEGTTLNRTKLP